MSNKLAAVLLLAACSVDESGYQNKIYTCDVTSADKNECGAGFSCYGAARQLGAPDFCAPTCTADGTSTVCTQGAALQKCNPSLNGPCPADSNCIRTDLIADSGVCLPITPCTEDKDCLDPVRRVCFSSEMARTYGRRTDIKKDHEFCYQAGCAHSGEACEPGSSCLPNVLGAGAPDVCVPDCDSAKRCPPNFICSTLFSQSDPHPTCIPGFLGFRCDEDISCVVGGCQNPVGTRFVCTTDCTQDSDCVTFNNQNFILPATFSCVQNKCLSPTLTLLDFCAVGQDMTDCPMGQTCQVAFAGQPAGTGICVQNCPTGGVCPNKGGFPQSCVNLSASTSQPPVCLIGIFGIPCQTDANCVTPLHCLAPIPAFANFKQCTIMCQSHADCQNHPAAGTQSYCAGVVDPAAAHVCVPKGDAGGKCIDPIQCKSGICNCPSGGCSGTNTGTCGGM